MPRLRICSVKALGVESQCRYLVDGTIVRANRITKMQYGYFRGRSLKSHYQRPVGGQKAVVSLGCGFYVDRQLGQILRNRAAIGGIEVYVISVTLFSF